MAGVVAIVGRANVGKSTIFNRIVGERVSIVEDVAGVTRDRIYATATWLTKEFRLIDTGGIELKNASFTAQIKMQAEIAIEEADLIVFVVNGREGVTQEDEYVARLLQRTKKPILLAVNKIDDNSFINDIYDFYSLGMGDPIPVSGSHGIGIGDLLDEIIKKLDFTEEEFDKDEIRFSIIGRPNVGKSTFLSRVTNAKPKIANYHFTTLSPNLGVVDTENGGFIIADIPGLIEGASEGVGLGHEFLRHIERTRVLVHIVDAASTEGRDPIDDIYKITKELEKYNPEIAKRPQVIAANKVDCIFDDGQENPVDRLRKEFEPKGIQVFPISGVTGTGIKELLYYVAGELEKLDSEPIIFEQEYFPEDELIYAELPYTVEKEEDIYVVEGPKIEKMLGYTNLDSEKGFAFFQKFLKDTGILDELEEAGIEEGDTVRMYGLQFDYYK